MATDKNKISAYLSDQDFSTLKTLAASYQVSKSQLVILAIRALAGQSLEVTPINLSSGVNSETMELLVKDEVSHAIAAALAPLSEDLENLKKQISDLLSSPPPLPVDVNQAIASLRSQVDRLEGAIEPYPGVIGKLKSEINSLKGSEPPESVEPVELMGLMESLELVEPMETIEPMEAVEAIAQVPEQTELTIEPMETDFSKGLTGKELAKRLKFSPSGLSRAWKPETDSEPRPEYFRKWSQENDPNKLAWEKKGDKYFPISD